MTDIVDVLIQRPCHVCGGDCSAANPPVNYCPKDEDVKAANEIKRLRAEVAALSALSELHANDRDKALEERDRLRELLREFVDDGYSREAAIAALGGEGKDDAA